MQQIERLVIAVDCDDVVVESVPAILDWYNHEYGTRVTSADFYGNDISVWGVTEDDVAIRRVNRYLETAAYQNLPPAHEAVASLYELKKRHELHLVTGRADFLQAATERWLHEHFADIFTTTEYTNYIVPSDKSHLSRTKAEVCRQLGADLLIDDHLHHAELVAAAGVRVLLFGNYPWNQSTEPLPAAITRVRDWPAVLRAVNTMAAERAGDAG